MKRERQKKITAGLRPKSRLGSSSLKVVLKGVLNLRDAQQPGLLIKAAC